MAHEWSAGCDPLSEKLDFVGRNGISHLRHRIPKWKRAGVSYDFLIQKTAIRIKSLNQMKPCIACFCIVYMGRHGIEVDVVTDEFRMNGSTIMAATEAAGRLQNMGVDQAKTRVRNPDRCRWGLLFAGKA